LYGSWIEGNGDLNLVLATRNEDKVREIREALEGLPVSLLSLMDFPQIGEIAETGDTLEENALLKAETVCAATGHVALADDTGLEVDALGGRPGVRSSRYAGESATYEDNVRKLLAEMKEVPPAARGATFRTVIALAFPDGTTKVVEGRCSGVINLEARGKSGFGYDPVFTPEGSKLTFAELTLRQKNAISHRGKALAAARKLLAELMEKRG
jgi:XTP/dITP diphosphohydrolase